MSDLVDKAIDAAGGMKRWREIETIDARLSLTGGLFNIKGLGGIENILMHVDTRRPAVDTSPYGGVGHVGHYTEEKTWITDGAGEVVEERVDPRARMLGAKMTDPWDRIGRLYFSSYALWTYLTTPFLLASDGLNLTVLDPHEEAGEVWSRLRVKFPKEVPSHSEIQTYYFNDKGLLQRLDYETDVAGGVAAHYCYDHLPSGGIMFPTLRRVVKRSPQDVGLLGVPTGVLLTLTDIYVR
jgi:hypothetical protein